MCWFSRTRGFSIVEALVALLLLSFGIYSAADIIMTARANAVRADKNLQATGLANLKLEEVRLAAAELHNALVQGGQKPLDFPANGLGSFEQNPQYAWKARIEPAPAALGTTEGLRFHITVFRSGTDTREGQATGLWYRMPIGTGANS